MFELYVMSRSFILKSDGTDNCTFLCFFLKECLAIFSVRHNIVLAYKFMEVYLLKSSSPNLYKEK